MPSGRGAARGPEGPSGPGARRHWGHQRSETPSAHESASAAAARLSGPSQTFPAAQLWRSAPSCKKKTSYPRGYPAALPRGARAVGPAALPGPRPPGPGFRRDLVRRRSPSPALGRAAAVPVSEPRCPCPGRARLPAVSMPSRVLCLGGGAGGPAARRVRLLLRQVVGGGAAAARSGRSEVRALHSSGNPPTHPPRARVPAPQPPGAAPVRPQPPGRGEAGTALCAAGWSSLRCRPSVSCCQCGAPGRAPGLAKGLECRPHEERLRVFSLEKKGAQGRPYHSTIP